MSHEDLPEEGDLIRFTFDSEIYDGREETAEGVVTDVEPDTDFNEMTDLIITADEAGTANQELHYYEGADDGEPFFQLTRYSPFGGKSPRIGTNVTFEVL